MFWFLLFFVVAVSSKVYKHSFVDRDGNIVFNEFNDNEPTLCDPSVKQHSGYFSASQNNKYFYWFFESRNNQANAPFIMWLTGGPGCSSILALLAENGPCTVTSDGRNTMLNQYSWNTNSNIMWVDQPPGTGFSTGTKVTNEQQIATDMYNFLQNFITAFPNYFKNGFYVIGESYAGHYVPNIVHNIYENNQKSVGKNIPLKGFAIGNGLTDPYIQFAYYAKMAYNSSTAKSVISAPVYNLMTRHIPECQKEIQTCNQNDRKVPCDNAYSYCVEWELEPVTITGVNPYNLNIKCAVPPLCYNFSNVEVWLNNATVQSDLGINPHMKWQSCDTAVNIRLEGDWMIDYQNLLPDLLDKGGIRGLIYAGDLDFICNWLGNHAWTLQMKWNGQNDYVKAPTRLWLNKQGHPAGNIKHARNFTFLQVFKAGHMVPMDQPNNALDMVNAFISNNL